MLQYTSFISTCHPVIQADQTLTADYDPFCVNTNGRPVTIRGFGDARVEFNSSLFLRSTRTVSVSITPLINNIPLTDAAVIVIVSHFGNFRKCSEIIVGVSRKQYCSTCCQLRLNDAADKQ